MRLFSQSNVMETIRRMDFVLLVLSVACVVSLSSSQQSEPRLTISPPQSPLTAPAGQNFGLVCRGEADDADEDNAFTRMRWITPNGDEITDDGNPSVKEFGSSGLKLSFFEPKADQSGIYKCTALYGNTKTLESEVELKFYEDITFQECPSLQNLIMGREGRINCRPVGNPQPTINWEKDKRRIKSEQGTITESGVLINTVSAGHAGIYTVEAFVPTTGINKYMDITVNVLTPPRINELPEEFTAIQGEEYTITCRAEGSDTLEYLWFDPQQRDLSKVEGFSVMNGLLTITNVDRNAGGEYKCRVKNAAGEDEASLRLDVQVRPTIVQLENKTKEVNGMETFECKAGGVPKPTITIRKDNAYGPFQDGDSRVKLVEYDEGELRVLSLTISSVKRSDDGLYFCKASNAAGDAEKAGHLEVLFQPDMSLTPTNSVKAWSANPANLSCISEANPNASIEWSFQGVKIEPGDERFQINGIQSQSNLLVRTDNRQYDVFGEYTCLAKNGLGDNSTTITLEEATAPGPVTQIIFDKVTSTTITFVLMGPGVTGGLPITNYIMKYKLESDPKDKTVTVDWIKGSPYIISDLIPRKKYQFRVAARNVVGEGPYMSKDYIMPEETAPESPTIITEQETISLSPDHFEVRWDVPNDNGEPITQFEVRYFKVERGIKGWGQVDKAVERIIYNWEQTPSFELTGLQPDTYYKIEIRATNKIGNSLPESVVIRTRAGEVNDGHISTLDEPPVSIPIIIAIVLIALFIVLVVLDVTCFFRYHCGLLYLIRYRTCGRSAEKMQGTMEEGRACVKEVSTANNGKIKSGLRSPASPDQLPPPENKEARPVDLIIDENFKNKSPKGSKTSIGKSSPV